ncbi:hypothetical protein JCM8547_000335 [Rhodosporidiobolus lusitaniae]
MILFSHLPIAVSAHHKGTSQFGRSTQEGDGIMMEKGYEGSAAGAGGQLHGENSAQEMGVTMGNDFSLRGMKGEREGDHVEPNALAGDSADTAGKGGDFVHREAGAHEMKGMKQRLERDDERADREAQGYDEPINRNRVPPTA